MKKKLVLPLLIIFLDIVSFSFLLPAITFIVQDFGYDAHYVGITVALTALGLALGGLVFGRLSDSFGKKKILLVSLVLNFLGYVLFGFAESIYLFIFARFLNGLGGGGMSILQAYIMDISSDKEKSVHMGYIGAVIGIGFILGPVLGVFLSHKSLLEIGLICGLILALSIVVTTMFFNPKLIYRHPHTNNTHVLRHKFPFFLLSFGLMATLLGLQTVLPKYLIDTFSYTMQDVYIVFGALGTMIVVYLGGFFPFVNKILSKKQIFHIGFISIIFSLLLMGLNASSQLYFYIALCLFGFGFANVNSIIFSWIGENTRSEHLGRVFGFNTMCTSSGEILGSFIAGYLYLAVSGTLFFYFAGFLIFITVFSYYKILKNTYYLQ